MPANSEWVRGASGSRQEHEAESSLRLLLGTQAAPIQGRRLEKEKSRPKGGWSGSESVFRESSFTERIRYKLSSTGR